MLEQDGCTMRKGAHIGVVIPALDEAAVIGRVIDEIPDWVDHVVVVDNGSRDGTSEVARTAGATVVHEPVKGYGSACVAGISKMEDVDLIVFLDGDGSDYPRDMAEIVDPILCEGYDLVIASRVTGRAEAGALTLQQRIGNALATFLIRLIWGVRFTDLGPFRAIRRTSLRQLCLDDRNFGWTVEMQIRAIQCGLTVKEVAARYRRRIGQSKVSGTVRGATLAGCKILYVIARHALRHGKLRRRLVALAGRPTPRLESRPNRAKQRTTD